MKLGAGTPVSDKVTLVRPLGKGGMGSVWVGRHSGLETDVAVKFISVNQASHRQLARFKREASLAAKIKSPHVVQIFDYGATVDGTPYMVMELLRGMTLADQLDRGTIISLRDAALLVSQLAKALGAAHELGIVHRDVKPANIFLLESGYQLYAKLLDFGVAKQTGPAVESVTVTGALVGTPHYMSPEQLLSLKDVDHRADLWALAVVTYHALTGTVPFSGKTIAALGIAVSEGRFAPVSSLLDDAPRDLDIWFKLALCRNINGRYRTAEDLAQTFEDCISSEPGKTSEPLIPRSARPEQLRAAGITVRGDSSDSDADTVAATTTHDHDGDVASAGQDERETPPIGDESHAQLKLSATVLAPGSPAHDAPKRDRTGWWVAMICAALVATVLIRNWGWWQNPAPPPMTSTVVPSDSSPPRGATTTSQPARVERSAAPALASSSPAVPPPEQPATARPTSPPKPLPPKPLPTPPLTNVDCSEPFVRTANGDLRPRPECLREP